MELVDMDMFLMSTILSEKKQFATATVTLVTFKIGMRGKKQFVNCGLRHTCQS